MQISCRWGRMQFECTSSKNGPRCKRLRESMKIKNTLNGINNVKCHWLFHIVSIPNGHMPLGGEQVVFGFAHTFWSVNKFIAIELDLVKKFIWFRCYKNSY